MGKSTRARAMAAPKIDGRDATPERLSHNEHGVTPALRIGREKMGYARKIIPPIDTMLSRGQLNDRQYTALAFYRDQASLAERSPVKSCLDRSESGSGDIPLSAAVISARITVGRIEKDLGSLLPIARAIAVDDKSLAQWCIDKHGGRERYDGRGRFVAIVPNNEAKVKAMALMELRMAASRIVQ